MCLLIVNKVVKYGIFVRTLISDLFILLRFLFSTDLADG